MRNLLKRGPKCDPIPPPPLVLGKGKTSGGNTDAFVTKDDPLRDTPEKAERYYKLVDAIRHQINATTLTAEHNMKSAWDPKDIEAALKLLNA